MKDNISLEESLKMKLESGEITSDEYESLLSKLGNLDLLNTPIGKRTKRNKSNWKISGARSYEGQTVDEPIFVAGRLNINGDLACPILTVSGAINVQGDLQVLESTKLNGAMKIDGNAKFGGPVKISGKLNVNQDIFFTDIVKISGKIDTPGNIISGNDMKISGQIQALSLRSKGKVKISGKINVDQDVICEGFISSGGSSLIKGNLKASEIEIAKKYREKFTDSYEFDDEADGIDSLPDLGRFITRVVKNVIPNLFASEYLSSSRPKIFEVKGNVEGQKLDLSYCRISGDIIGDEVIVGPDVQVDGRIIYKSAISTPQGIDYNIEQNS